MERTREYKCGFDFLVAGRSAWDGLWGNWMRGCMDGGFGFCGDWGGRGAGGVRGRYFYDGSFW